MQHAKFLFKWPFSGVTRGCVTSSKGSLLEKMEQVFAGWMLFFHPANNVNALKETQSRVLTSTSGLCPPPDS